MNEPRYPRWVICPACGAQCEVEHCDPDTGPLHKPYAQCSDENCAGYQCDIHVDPIDEYTEPMFGGNNDGN